MATTTTPIQLAAQSYVARSPNVSCQRLVNLYLESNPQGAKGPVTLYGTPGLRPLLSVGDGPIRGLHFMPPHLYVVSGNELWAVNSLLAATLVGTIAGTGNVHMTNNGTHIAVATDTKLYAANATTLVELPEDGMNGATYQDGYGIFSETLSQRFWITAVDDMTTINPFDYSTADASPGVVRGVISDHRELCIFKDDSIEFWYNNGDATFPFGRVQGGFIEKGCAAPHSIAKADHRVFWLGSDLSVYSMGGYQPQLISTPAIDLLIKAIASPQTAKAWTYRQDGHTFYVLTFADLTIVYDSTTGMWHERVSDGVDRWRANCYAEAFGLHVVGDFENGSTYTLDNEYYGEGNPIGMIVGAAPPPIKRQVVSPPISAGGDRFSICELFLDMETGVGLSSGQGSDPVVLLDWSDDDGRTWSQCVPGYAGKLGQRTTQVRWNRLGTSRNRVLRFTCTEPVKTVIIGASARLEVHS